MGLFKGKKFNISRNAQFFSVGLTVFLWIAYVLLLCDINGRGADNPAPYLYLVVRDVLLVLGTIALTSIITARHIEIKDKNELYEGVILNDVLANPTFYQCFSDDVKEGMLKALETNHVFFGYRPLEDMYGSIKDKLAQCKDVGYYFSKCEYDVVCSIKNDVIIKDIKRTISLRSFDATYSLEHFQVLKWNGVEFDDNFQFKKVQDLYGKIYDAKPDAKPDAPNPDSLSDYNSQHTVNLSQPLSLSSTQDTTLVIYYRTCVPLSDSIYTCRSSVPCQRFSVLVRLKDSPNYQLSAAAFGFLDSAPYAQPNTEKDSIRVEFNDWVFTKDGVAVVFSPKETPPKPKAGKKSH